MIEYRGHITRAMLQAEPDTLFVFGDNSQRRGFGGQAKEMRGEPNAVGIPTKKAPSMRPGAFFSEADLPMWNHEVRHDIARLELQAAQGGLIVWPSAGIGTGLAQLEKHAPGIWASIEAIRISLETV